jgi:2-succinyl-5-enolpyruvyl-6-hydroxy-3-cyclohexene-1-carboxylate synthase
VTLPVTVQAAFAATLVDEWLRAGISEVVVAPGSRSTPLALAVDAAPLRVHVHLDERSAAFYALGLALATGRPAPVVVTSGTAAAELHPAVVEAHHAGVPLLVCTADRPAELHDVGAPQTIEQAGLFGAVLRWRADVSADDLPPAAWRSVAARLVAAALDGPRGPGPVQLNLAFREPLVGAPGALVPSGRPAGRPWHAVAAGPAVADVGSLDLSGRRGVIVAGAGVVEPAAVHHLARTLGWPVLAAPASGCRSAPAGAVAAFDAVLRHGATAERLRPSVVVHLGSSPASKVLAAWAATIEEHVVADPFGAWIDPERTASWVVAASPESLCHAIVAAGPEPATRSWTEAWAAAEGAAQGAIDHVLAAHPEVTEPGVARAVTSALEGRDTLVVASSMPVRDVEWYGSPVTAGRVVANRGANGIDGVVSTALGVAAGSSGRTIALLGDLAFLHDSGGLLWASRRGAPCCVVVLDNNGGGIFSFLPQAALPTDQFERLWGTPHGIDLTALAAVHGIPAVTVSTADGLDAAIGEALKRGGVEVVVARSDRAANVAVHDELVAAVCAALDG